MKLSSLIKPSKSLKEYVDMDAMDSIQVENSPYYVLGMLDNGEDLWDPLIEPSVYKQALTEFVKYGEFIHFPIERYIDKWWTTIVKNTWIIESITELAGHTTYLPYDDMNEYFGDRIDEYIKENHLEGKDTYTQYSHFLWDNGYMEKMVLPDGSDAWSDYGLKPLFNIIFEYNEDMKPEEVLVLINRALDVVHARGDLASAFIKGGRGTLTQITNEGLILTKKDMINERVEGVYNQYKSFYIKDNHILSESSTSYLSGLKHFLSELYKSNPNELNVPCYITEDKITFWKRIAGFYNPKTKELDDSIDNQIQHQNTDEKLLEGMVRFYICDFKTRECFISAIEKEDAIKGFKFLKNHYKDMNIDYFNISYGLNEEHTIVFDANGKRDLTHKMYEVFKRYLHQPLNESEEIDEMAYPSNFDLQHFTELKSFKDRVAYCKDRLPLLGNGSSRIAFKVDDEKVLKIAKNKKGLIQNEHECDWGRNQYGCFGEIYEADTDNYKWLEMELARPAKKEDFPKLMGVTFSELCCILDLFYNQYTNERHQRFIGDRELRLKCQEYVEKEVYTEKNEQLYRLYTYMCDYQPNNVQDWKAVRNWGVVNRNGNEELIIIDDGVNDEILNQYYSRKGF